MFIIKDENKKVKEIDKKILEALRRNLELKDKNIEMVSKEEADKILNVIEERKRGIFLLFKGDFSLNEETIKRKFDSKTSETSFYEKVANRVLLKRVDAILDRMINSELDNGRLVSVCADRQFFIQKVFADNIPTNFIEECVNNKER